MFSVCCGGLAADVAARVSFSREIQPILSNKCYFCHGPDEGRREAGLRLDTFEGATARFKDSEGSALVPGKPENSAMLKRMRSTDPEVVMPPPHSHLTMLPEEIALIERWIHQGAQYEPHWAFTPLPETISVPQTTNPSWPANPIDSFVLARLEKEGLQPCTAAPPERWLRRVTYDLTGLPPTQAEIDDLLAAPSAREAIVDRLLASPRFGEHRATAWLDVARYADSFGYQADVDTEAWPYRDWVIRAFNENLPVDQFIIHQLAGDLLPEATRDQRLATAFNRIHRKTNEGGSVPEELRQDGISDRIHTVGTAFLGLTFECARCHDHKYDPILMKDYYSLGAFFNSIDEFGTMGFHTGVLPQPALPLPTPEQQTQLAALHDEIATQERELADSIASAEAAFREWLVSDKTHPDTDLAGHFDFDGPANEAVLNKTDPSQSAILGANQLAEGKSGNGVLANGDDAVRLPDFGIRHADQPFSISLWFKPAEAHPRAVVFANSSSADLPYSGYELLLENGRLTWMLAREFPGSAASIRTTASMPVREWTHVTVTNDGSRRASGLRIFINGKPVETSIVADTLERDFSIGGGLSFTARSRDSGLRGGVIDGIQIHRRAITPLEAAASHAGKSAVESATTHEELREFYRSAVDPRTRELSAKLNAARAACRDAEKNVREIVTMRETPEPVPAYILERGDYTAPKQQVERATPGWLPPFPADQPRNRLGFARWLTSPDHPLTARVAINRVWQEIFGRGIVETSDNFGLQGAQPSHPELLDWLARDFINHGWDLKHAIKQMVLSATYAQDSAATPELRERDPSNSLLARGPARRLSAEQLRDSALAHSGLLSATIGGPSVKPYQAPGSMWKTLNNFLPEYTQDTGEGLYRRSLYTFWRRTTTPPNMMIFDATTRDVCATRRQTTNTPLQPLVTLNDPQFVEAARKLGERILKHGGPSDESRAKWAYREVIGKTPTSGQLAVLLEIIAGQRESFASKSSDAAALLTVGESKPDPALDPTESATFAMLAQALINLDAHLTLR
jgi:hypothetical protein